MSVYDNYNISIKNNNFTINSNEIELLTINSNSNFFLSNIKSPNYLFDDNSGIFFNKTSKEITYSSSCNIFTSDLVVKGILKASYFPSNVLILNENNKIDSSYLPSVNNFIVYNTNSVAIGTNAPIANLQLNDGDAFFKNARIGIGTYPAHYLHIDKKDTMPLIPAMVISSGNKKILDVYSEIGSVIINNDNSPLDFSCKLNVCGLMKANELKVSSNFSTSNRTIINNDLYINKLNSFQSSIIIESNVDLILSNNSIGSLSSNIINLNNSVKILNSNNDIYISSSNSNIILNNSNNQLIITSNNIILNDLSTSSITTSNLKLLNIDGLTSNPSAESVMDFKGKIRLFNDSENIPINIFANDNNLFIITKNNKLISYSYETKEFLTISSSFSYNSFKSKYGSYAYSLNSNIYLNGTLIISNKSFRDFAISPNSNQFFYVNQTGSVVSLNISGNTELINTNNSNVIKIDTYINNFYVVLTSYNSILIWDGATYNQLNYVNISPNFIIQDFANGDTHTILKTNQGLWSFGSNINNLTFKKGYTTTSINIDLAEKIPYFSSININSIKAHKNSSIVYDVNSNVYIFGNINKLYQTQTVYKINDVPNVLDFCCNNENAFLLTYFNDIFYLSNNNLPIPLTLPTNFYGTSIKSKGSLSIGGNYFHKTIPPNSLLIQNFLGVGSNITYNPSYSMIVDGNINIIGSLYNNGVLFTGTSGGSSSITTWNKLNNNLYYDKGNVGIGIISPLTPLHVDGTATFESNVIIKGRLISNENSPFVINNLRSIYFKGRIGINSKNPSSSLEISDGTLNITSIRPSSNLLNFDNYSTTIVNTSLNTSYYNPIIICQDGSTIISSYFNNENINNNNNNSNVSIYKLINNIWTKYEIRDITNNDTAFGQSIAISKDGSKIFIGAFKEKTQLGLLTGGIYKYSFNSFNNLIKNPIRETSITQNSYNFIGRNINCSGDANIIASTISNNNFKFYIKNLELNLETILDFSPYNIFHSSFNSINPNDIIIDINDNGSIILVNYIPDISLPMSSFAYFNFYIIKDYEIYFFKYNSIFQNSLITSLSISGDNTRIYASTSLGHNFIFDIDFQKEIYKTTVLNSTTTIKYYDIIPTYYFYRYDINTYIGKLSKNGDFIHLSNNKSIYIYKFNLVTNLWDGRIIYDNINQITDINNYSISISADGFNMSMSILKKLIDTNLTDDIQINNYLYNIHKDLSIINYNATNLVVNTDVIFNSNIYCENISANGSNLSNLLLTNLVNNHKQNGMVYTRSNLIYTTSNINYNEDLRRLQIDSQLILTSNFFVFSNITTASNISTTFGDISSGKGILSTSNIVSYSNIIATSNLSTTIGNISSASNISAGNNISAINNITAGNRITCFYDINTLYGSFRSGNNLFADKEIFASNNITSVRGNISGGSNIIARSNLFAQFYYGDGSFLSNINSSNLSNIVQINRGGTGRDLINRGEILFGDNSNPLLSTQEFNYDLSTTTLNLDNINIKSNLTLNGCNFSNLNFTFDQITGVNNFEKGGLGFNEIGKSNLIFASDSNKLYHTSNLQWDNDNSNLFIDGNIYVKKIYGDGCNISNLRVDFQTIGGVVPFSKGGFGFNEIGKSNLFYAFEDNQISATSNMKFDGSNLFLDGDIYINKIYGDGSNLSNLKIDFNTIVGVIPLSRGGLGFNQINQSNLVFASEDNQLNPTSNLMWDEINSILIVNGFIYGDGSFISNINSSNISNIIQIDKGGTGRDLINKGEILFGDDSNPLVSSSNFNYDLLTTTLNVDNINIKTNLTLNGVNLNNLNFTFDQITGTLPFQKGGLGFNSISKSNLIFANEDNQLNPTSNLMWDEINSNLLVNGYIYGDGYNISNINYSNIAGIIPFDKGGLGFNIIGKCNLIYANEDNMIKPTYRLMWDEMNSKLLVNGRIYGDGSNITNLDYSNIMGVINFEKGGLGFNQISKSNLIFANEDNQLLPTSNLMWDELNSNLIINGYIYGDGSNITNLNYSNITGVINFEKGGLGFNQISKSNLIFANEDNQLLPTSNLMWDETNSNLLVNGYMNIGFNERDINYKLRVDGNVYVSGNVIGLSDINYKKNIEIIESPLDKIEKLRGVYYNKIGIDKKQIGMIAQEVEMIIPEVVYDVNNDTKAIAYDNLIGLLVEGIKELSSIIKRIQ